MHAELSLNQYAEVHYTKNHHRRTAIRREGYPGGRGKEVREM